MLLLICSNYDQYNIILIISFVIIIHQLVATLIVRYSLQRLTHNKIIIINFLL